MEVRLLITLVTGTFFFFNLATQLDSPCWEQAAIYQIRLTHKLL